MQKMPPTSDQQIGFLVNLQRLLDEGLFVATYKFALLLSLADLSIELGDDSGGPLTLATVRRAQLITLLLVFPALQALPYGRRTAQYWNSPIRAPSGNTHRFSPTCCTASKIGEPARSAPAGASPARGPSPRPTCPVISSRRQDDPVVPAECLANTWL